MRTDGIQHRRVIHRRDHDVEGVHGGHRAVLATVLSLLPLTLAGLRRVSRLEPADLGRQRLQRLIEIRDGRQVAVDAEEPAEVDQQLLGGGDAAARPNARHRGGDERRLVFDSRI